jgi:hypothetical protein
LQPSEPDDYVHDRHRSDDHDSADDDRAAVHACTSVPEPRLRAGARTGRLLQHHTARNDHDQDDDALAAAFTAARGPDAEHDDVDGNGVDGPDDDDRTVHTACDRLRDEAGCEYDAVRRREALHPRSPCP